MLIETGADEILPKLSPDEPWLAYSSNVSGRLAIYVGPLPGLGATFRVSPNSGVEPLRSPTCDRLCYRSENGRRVFAVDALGGDPLQLGVEELLFDGSFTLSISWAREWDIHPDGGRFLILEHKNLDPVEGIRVATNWFSELERLVPTGD